MTGLGPVCKVSGANTGIGKEIARGLAEHGYTVLLGARKRELGEAAAAEIADAGDVLFLELDVTSDASVESARATVHSLIGRLDVLVRSRCVRSFAASVPCAAEAEH